FIRFNWTWAIVATFEFFLEVYIAHVCKKLTLIDSY
ncbi:MAG: hypothetical protein K0S24_4329, partial [Sphingobacterium sp.]|nr:hypothetical protein [Sphingobacterium sp.]